MAPFVAHQELHHYQRRSMDEGVVFTVLFVTVAAIVLIICFVWGFGFPYIRQMYFPSPPSSTKFNQRFQPYGSDTRLIHSSFRRQASTANSRHSSTRSVFDPVYHSPDLGAASNHEFIALRTLTPPRVIQSSSAQGESLFTPVRDRVSSWPDPHIPRSYTLPRVRPCHERSESAGTDAGFGDAREYILALPEPLRLRSRTHGDGLVASNTLDRLPDLNQLSSSADKTVHPKKLFEQLRNQEHRNSKCSSTSLKRKASTDADNTDTDGFKLAQLFYPSTEEHDQTTSHKEMESTTATTNSELDQHEMDEEDYNASVTAMHRLRTYRSLVGAPPPEPLSRAGTLTRPKTSVAKLRDMYDRSVSDSKLETKTVSRNDTVSTFLANTVDASDRQSTRSSATSPPKITSEPFRASSSSLVPTPLRVRHESESRSVSSPARRSSKFTEELDDENDQSQFEEIALSNQTPSKNSNRRPRGFSTAMKSRPTPLKFTAGPRVIDQQGSLYTNDSPTMHKTQISRRIQMPSMQASSIYSRDTQGVSIAQTPTTPTFARPPPYQSPVSPYNTSIAQPATESDKGTKSRLVKKSTPTRDAAKAKVENWNVAFERSPSVSLNQTASLRDPEQNSPKESRTEENNRHSTISTELAPSEARLSGVAGTPLRMSSFRFGGFGRRRPAPGGADWV